LFKATYILSKDEPSDLGHEGQVMIKIYGDGTDITIDRQSETSPQAN